MNKYQTQINKLDAMINHWDELANSDTAYEKAGIHDVQVNQGLCYNADLLSIDQTDLLECFEAYTGYSGNALYPIEGVPYFYHKNANKFTEDRLKFAKHVRSFLYFRGEPKPTQLDILKGLLSHRVVLCILLFVIFFLFGAAAFSTIPNEAI